MEPLQETQCPNTHRVWGPSSGVQVKDSAPPWLKSTGESHSIRDWEHDGGGGGGGGGGQQEGEQRGEHDAPPNMVLVE